MSLRAHRAATYATSACAVPACACLPAPRLPARCHATIVSSHVVSARVKRAGPVSAATQPACLRDVLRLRDPARLLGQATLCHPATLCDSAPTPSVLRSRRTARMACHLSPPTRGEPSQSSPTPSCLGHTASRRDHLHCHPLSRSLLLTCAWILCCQAFATHTTLLLLDHDAWPYDQDLLARARQALAPETQAKLFHAGTHA